MKCDCNCHDEIILTPEGDEVYRYDMERVHQGVPALEFMDELLEMGYKLIPWKDLHEIEIGEVADRFHIYSDPMCPDIISPALRQSPETPDELAVALDPWLIPPGQSQEDEDENGDLDPPKSQPQTADENSTLNYQSQRVLELFDNRGETAALRYIIDAGLKKPPDQSSTSIEFPDGSAIVRNSEESRYRFQWPNGQVERKEAPAG